MCACAAITCMQVCEAEPQRPSSLITHNLQRGRLHHRWTPANCPNAEKQGRLGVVVGVGSNLTTPPTPTHAHTPIFPSFLHLLLLLLLHFAAAQMRTSPLNCYTQTKHGERRGKTAIERKEKEKKRSSSQNKQMKKLPQYVIGSRAGAHIHKALTYIHSNTAPLWSSSPRTH